MTGDLPEPETPSHRELLERIEKVEAENVRLKNLLIRVLDGSNRLTLQVGDLIQKFGLMDMQVIELTERVFPGYVETQRQIIEICGSPPKTDNSNS